MKFYALILTALLVSVAANENSPADVMARNILEWIQGIYRQGVRKTRQQSDNAYLPPYSTQRPPEKPRPFQSASIHLSPSFSNRNQNEVSGSYPDYGSQSSSEQSYSSNQPLSMSSFTTIRSSSSNNGYNTGSASSGYSSSFGAYPMSSTTYLPPSQTSSSIGSGYPYPSPGSRPIPTFPTTSSRLVPGSRSGPRSGPRPGPGFRYTPESASGSKVEPDSTSGARPGILLRPMPGPVSEPTTGLTPDPNSTSRPASGSELGLVPVSMPDENDDSKHPPHIHSLDVECSKTMMNINIEFNRNFDGVIYSKGFFMIPQCRYVEQNSGQTKYSFTLNLDSCGTQFINDFEEAGQAYLENVLVLQNEPGIQEIWDTVRTVRCLWEGNINKALRVSLSVDMLNQELVTFSGDTATAKLDIQVGKGPFAPAANGLVKIGDTMTLVVSVEGDPAFDLQVRDCVARDELSTNVYELSDERGCILKPKLFGAFQKTNETGNSGASIIAYAFFQAFKFPDVMDLFIECNVELCKKNCESCLFLYQYIMVE